MQGELTSATIAAEIARRQRAAAIQPVIDRLISIIGSPATSQRKRDQARLWLSRYLEDEQEQA